MGILDILLENDSNKKFKVGDKVRVKYREQEGYIISVDGNLYMVSMENGELVDSYYEEDLEKCL